MPLPGDSFFADREAAIEALASVGAPHDERMDLVVEHATGRVLRLFGVLSDLTKSPSIGGAVAMRLADDLNTETMEEFRSGKLRYAPVNKDIVQRLLPELRARKLHLPWSWRVMNFDLGTRLQELHGAREISFRNVYCRFMEFKKGRMRLGRIYSLPIGGTANGTWAAMIDTDMVDPDVALVIEANISA